MSAGAAARPGGGAAKPWEIPPDGWKQIAKRSWAQSQQHQLPLLAAGVAFWWFVALFPGLILAITVYGLVADPSTVRQQVENLASALPQEARTLLVSQLESIASGSGGALTFGLLLSLAGALWTASGGIANLMKAVTVAYDEEDSRGFAKVRGAALAGTLGFVVFLALAVGLIAVLPVVLDALGLEGVARFLVQVVRWVGLVALVLAALALVYRYAPDRAEPQGAWTSTGAVLATLLWLLGSVAFSLYVSNFGSYAQTYGAIAGVIVLLLWLFLTAFVVLFGAEVNSETERQTGRDTTAGERRPAGRRGAEVADTGPDDA